MSESSPVRDDLSPARSPYDPEPDMGERRDEVSWKTPVVAAIVGALAVATFVIYAMVTGPGVFDASNDEVTSPTVSAQPADDLPPGYVLFDTQVGARVESINTVPSATFVSVSTAVPGSAEATAVPQPDVALWELVTLAGTFPMQDQFGMTQLAESNLGNFTVAFSLDEPAESGELLGYLVESTADASTMLELGPGLPTEVADFRIDVGGGPVIVVDSLQINDDGGYVEWRVEGGLTARVDVIVSFTDTGEAGQRDTILVPEYVRNPLDGPSLGTEPEPLPYSFGSGYRLVSVGAPVDPDNPPTGISVEFRITAVTSVAAPVSLPIGRSVSEGAQG